MNIPFRKDSSAQIATAPMADIAFLLIIFFMLTSVLSSDKGIEHQLGRDQAEAGLPLVVWVEPNGRAIIAGQPFELSNLEPATMFLMNYATRSSDAQAVLVTHDKVPYGEAVQWLNLLEINHFEVSLPLGKQRQIYKP